MSLTKKCKGCQKGKTVNEFPVIKSRGKEYRSNFCDLCIKQKQEDYRKKNRDKKRQTDKAYYESIKNTPEFVEKTQKYRSSRKEDKKEYDKNYRETHAKEIKEYNINNKEAIAETRRNYYFEHKEARKLYNQKWYAENKDTKHSINAKYVLKRFQKDVSFRLRYSVSRTINKHLKLTNSSKNGNSILDFIPYSIDDLKEHLQNQFEPWMNWDNWGSYNKKTWNDEDTNTWTWQIDHIIPQSELSYSTMEDDNFKKCWSLANLRPLSSKQNLLDGVGRIRHERH